MTGLVSATETGGVLTVTLRRPDKRNALSRPLLAELRHVMGWWAGHEGIAAAVLTGEGDKAFASGGDLRELDAVRTAAEARAFAIEARAALDAVRQFPVPVLAALNGDALGGGAELALACDVRFAASHARIGFLQGTLAISTAWGGGSDLFQLLGPSRAIRLLCTGEVFDAERARALGLIDEVAGTHEPFDAAVAAFAGRFAARRPQVARAFKSLAIAHRAAPAAMAATETDAFVETWMHDDHWAAAAAVLNRRKGAG